MSADSKVSHVAQNESSVSRKSANWLLPVCSLERARCYLSERVRPPTEGEHRNVGFPGENCALGSQLILKLDSQVAKCSPVTRFHCWFQPVSVASDSASDSAQIRATLHSTVDC